MKNFNYLYNKYIKSGYELYYGTWSIIDPNIISVINEYGSYEPRLIRDQDITDNSLEKIERIILSSDLSHNETYVSKQLFGGNANIKYDEKLGYYLGLYIGFVKELDYRKNGSSGGFGTWILTELLNKGLIDGVIHVKENDNKEKLFEYTISNNQDEVIEGASTKYYPVELSEILRKVKGQPGKYAIVGTPAVIMGIRLLSEEDPIIKDRIKYTIGLVCGHHKSTKFAEFLAWQCGIEPGNLKKINFRKKIENSNSNDYAMEAIGEIDNVEEVVSKKMSTLYGHDWGKGLFKEISSDYTDDVMNETADITLGDAWLPQYTIDSMGNNILIVRNKDINDIILEGIELKRLKLDITDAEMINKSQSAHYRHTRDELSYRIEKKRKASQWYPNKRLNNERISIDRKVIQNLRERMALRSHLYYKQAVNREDISYFYKKMKYLDYAYDTTYFLMKLKKLGIKGLYTKIKSRL